MQENYKIAILGDVAVGKSSIAIRFVHNSFDHAYIPSVEDHFFQNVYIKEEAVRMEILDTTGEEGFVPLRNIWISEKDGFLLVYSVTDKKSLEDLNDYFSKIDIKYGPDTPPIALSKNTI